MLRVAVSQSTADTKAATGTHSLPVQNVDASLANHATTPRSSSGLPIRPIGFRFSHFCSR